MESDFRRLIENLGKEYFCYRHDVDGNMTYVSPSIAKMLGYAPQEYRTHYSKHMTGNPANDSVDAFTALSLKGERQPPYEVEVFHKDGSVRWLEISEIPLRDPAGDIVGLEGIAHDVTERKRAEAGLRASELRFKELFDQAPLGIASIDSLTGRIEAVNPMFAKIAGRSMEDLSSAGWMSIAHPDDVREDLAQMARMNAGEIPGFKMEKRYLHRDGAVVWINMTIVPLRVEDKTQPRHLCMIEDITERKQAEAALRNVQKLESLGALAGGIAHDFNNILTVILGNLSLLQSELPAGGTALELITEAQNACGTAKGLSNQLLTFAKGGTPVVSVMDLRPVLAQATAFATRGTNTRCVLDLGEIPLTVRIDKDQIAQVVQNLILNATQAMPQGGDITVRADVVALEMNAKPYRAAGRYVRLTVADQGTGIKPAHLSKIFDPYFSTKGVGRGLGLAMSYSIMVKHGGNICAEMKPGAGAVFTLHLPAENAADMPAGQERPARTTGSGKVLVMDDEAPLAKVLKRMLEHLGYQTEVVKDGQAALDAYAQAMKEGRPYDAVIMDLTVAAGMGGKEAIGKLKALDPQARAIVSSGYANDPVLAGYAAHGFSGVLGKPYTIEQVSEALRLVFLGRS